MAKRSGWMGVVALLLVMVSSLTWAEESADETGLSEKRTLTAVLAEADYPPFYWKAEGKLRGISIDVLSHISEVLDIEIKYMRLSWPRVLQSLERGRVDMVTTFFNTPERAPHVVYTGVPHTYESNHFFTLADSGISYEGDLDQLSSYRIGAIKGYSYGKEFDQAEYLLVERVLDEPTLVRMMHGNRFDLAVGNPYAIRLEARRQAYKEPLRFLDPPVDRSPIFMAFSRQLPDAIELSVQFTEVIHEFKKTEEYQALQQRYDASP